MKPIKNLFFISIIPLLFGSSCQRDDKYYDLPENYKSAGLYYALSIGDSFSLIRNSTDTIAYVVSNTYLRYIELAYNNLDHYQELYVILNDNSTYFYTTINYESGNYIE